MPFKLNKDQRDWVESTLNKMSMEELVGMLLCPEDRQYSKDDWLDLIKKVPAGNIFYGKDTPESYHENLQAIQARSKIPVTVAVDMEVGVTPDNYGTKFPTQMAIGASNDPQYAYEMGQILAKEARALGLHWTYSPVVDINLNFNNPVTNTRSFGDNAEKVSQMVVAAIKGRQAGNLMAATAKHFPGDGVDDRDQHTCTTINSLPEKQWRETYGKVWKAAIDDANVKSIMSGHISFPAYQGFADDLDAALPATLCRKLQIDLLRKELGFQGVIVSDAAPMIGYASRVNAEDMAVENILSGSDVYLFAEPVKDFNYLMQAVKSGRLPEEQVYQSAKRVLEMKASLNLHVNPFGATLSNEVFQDHSNKAQKVADKSITLLKDDGKLPVSLPKGAKILTVTLTYKKLKRPPYDLEIIDQELIKRGYEVEHLVSPGHAELSEKARECDFVFCNMYVSINMRMGTIRATADAMMSLWRAFFRNTDNVIFTSFGNPYVTYEQPHLPNMLLAYGPSDYSQRAAVKVWLGELEPQGVLPFRVPVKRIQEFS